MLVGIGDALVVFLFEFVFVGIGIGIAPAPELFNEPLALVIGCKFLKGLSLFIRDDVSDIILQLVFVSCLELRLHVARLVHGIRAWALPRVLSKTKQAGAS